MDLKVLNSNKSLRLLYAVKQFTAAFVFAVVALQSTAYADRSCMELFVESPNLKTNVFEKSYSDYKKENEKRFSQMADDTKPLLNVMSKEEIKDKFDIDKIYDRSLLGPLGQLFDLKTDAKTKQVIIEKNKFDFKQIEESNKALIEKINHIDNKKYDKIFESIMEIENLTDNTVLLQVSSIGKNGQTNLESAVKHYFQSMYYKMVNWKYRVSGLMDNRTVSSLLLMDDVSVYANENKFFDFALVFDKKVWEVQKSILTDKIDQYYKAETDLQKNIEINKINDPTEPFMPMAGMAQAKHAWIKVTPEAYALMGLKPVKYPVELKRYFKNDMEDPLGLLNINTKENEFLIRNKMIYKIIEKLPEGTPLEIHAHTSDHVTAYAKWGFVDVGLIESEKFKDMKVHLLTASREEMLLKIKAIIDKNR